MTGAPPTGIATSGTTDGAFTSPGPTRVIANGFGNVAAIVMGTSSNGLNEPLSRVAFDALSNSTLVDAGRGPFAVAVVIGQSNASVTKSEPGFNINGVRVGRAAAVRPASAKTGAAQHDPVGTDHSSR